MNDSQPVPILPSPVVADPTIVAMAETFSHMHKAQADHEIALARMQSEERQVAGKRAFVLQAVGIGVVLAVGSLALWQGNTTIADRLITGLLGFLAGIGVSTRAARQ